MAMILLLVQTTIQGGLQSGAKAQAPGTTTSLTLVSISVSPGSITVSPDAIQNFTAGGTYNDGSQADVTSQCTWSSSNTAVAQIGAAAAPQPVNALATGTATIRCGIGSIAGTATLTVSGMAVITTNIPLGTVGNPYSATFAASGGTLPYTFSITTGLSSLTGIGLSFTSPTLSGTPTAAGNYGFMLTVHDSSTPPQTATYNYVLLVNAIVPPVAGGYAEMPKVWVDTHECDPPGGVYQVNKTMYADNTGDYACNLTALNQAIQDWATSGLDQSERLKIGSTHDSHGGQCRIISSTNNNVTGQFVLRAKVVNGNLPTKCFVIESTTPNPNGSTVCAGSDNPMQMTRNFGCASGPWKANMWYLEGRATGASSQGGLIIAGPYDTASGWGVNHIVIRDAEIVANASGNSAYFFLDYGPRTAAYAARASLPRPDPKQYGTDVGIERSYLHADADNTYAISPNNVRVSNVISLFANNSWLMWNYFDKWFCPQCESKLTVGTWVLHGLKMVGNWFEGGAITSFWGGTAYNIPATNPQPADMEMRKNRWTFNPNWMPLNVGCAYGANGSVGGSQTQSRKNPMEFKTGWRVLLNGNVQEYNHVCGQSGQLLTMNTRASSNNTWADNYGVKITDFTVTNNVFRHAVVGIQVDGRSGPNNAGQGSAWPAKRWTFINNLFYDIGPSPTHPGSGAVTIISSGAANLAYLVSSVSRVNGIAELVLRPSNGANPANGTGMLMSRFSPGDAVAVTGCATATAGQDLSSFNTPNPSSAIGPNLTADTTNPDGLTISYPNAGPNVPVTDALGAGCNAHSRQGYPEYLVFSHNTILVVSGQNARFPSNMTLTSPVPSFVRHATYQDNLMAQNASGFYGWMCCGQSEGNASARVGWDVNTLTIDHMMWPGRVAQRGNYTAWNAACAAAGGCLTGSNAASTLWFPASVSCTGPTVAGQDCIGFTFLMNGAAYNANPSNPFVDLTLVPDSPYKAGNARQAHDGTDMGAHYSEMQKAMTEQKYSGCSNVTTAPNYCGPTGPYPD